MARTGSPEEWGTDIERTVNFSDAVFAIAITLAALYIPVPEAPPETLLSGISPVWHELTSYAISFLVVGSYWLAHHRIFHYIERYDQGLLVRNLVFLLAVGLLSFTTGMMGAHENSRTAVVVYAGHMAATGLLLSWVWWYAARGGAVVADVDRRVLRYHHFRAVAVPGIFLLSIPLAFVDLTLAKLSWLALLGIGPAYARLVEPARGFLSDAGRQ
ncbi:TMEM175 family protein [Halomarina pelagica]|uniref:TMEM175 family protein n=1 Tax=Halomarina pelagica TaxID=2961599 RepID=UPI0020C4DE42|nr:TMEM175 family protein [Halomarina sp. BND7]